MAVDDEKRKRLYPIEQDGDVEGSNQGGATGAIHFRYKDAMSVDPRDDALPPAELKRLLAVHEQIHKAQVDKQKQLRKERKLLKEGRASLNSRAEFGISGGTTFQHPPYKKHRIADKAQFSGIDRQVTALPSHNVAETNEEQRNKLEHSYQLRHQNVPRFHPKPRPY